jgi:hypothetical protein
MSAVIDVAEMDVRGTRDMIAGGSSSADTD